MSLLDPGKFPLLSEGTPLRDAAGAIILLHGRGGTAEEILHLGRAIAPVGWAMLAPQAHGNSWYPLSFLAPRKQNEPQLTSALGVVRAVLETALAAGIEQQDVALAGFSQGACLSTEYVGRNPRRYAALLAFTGGLLGPMDVPLELSGNLDGTPVLLSAGDPDSHVPWARVQQSAELLQQIGGIVTLRRYPGKAHSIAQEEIEQAREILSALV